MGRYFTKLDSFRLGFATSRWHRVLYGTRRFEGGSLIEAEDAIADPVSDHYLLRLDDPSDDDADVAVSIANAHAEVFGSEVFARLYNDPNAAQGPERWAQLAHGAISQVPEFEALRGSVEGDPDMAALAAASLMKVVAEHLPDLLKAEEQDHGAPPPASPPGAEEQQGGDEGGEGEGDNEGEGEGESNTDEQQSEDGGEQEDEGDEQESDNASEPGEAEQEAQEALMKELRGAARSAQNEIGEVQAGLSGVSAGLGSRPPVHVQETDARMKLAERLRADPRLRKVLQLAGRIVRINERVRMAIDPHGVEEVVDVERGGDIDRILPSELAGLAVDNDLLKLLTLSRISERATLQYRLEGKDRMGRGPIEVLVDRSDSMWGWSDDPTEMRPTDYASALSVACLGIAERQHRGCNVQGFASYPLDMVQMNASGQASLETSRYSSSGSGPIGGLMEAAEELLSWGAGGGTNFDIILSTVLDRIDPKADLIFVTDGEDSVNQATLARIEEAKANGTRVWGLVLNGGKVTAAIKALCDGYVNIDAEEDIASAIGSLGIGRD